MMTILMTLLAFALLALAGCLFRSLLQEELGMGRKDLKQQRQENKSAIHFIKSI